ncbi:hypothetical protein Droror1_Dr00013685 [Drosera rotundifolia]
MIRKEKYLGKSLKNTKSLKIYQKDTYGNFIPLTYNSLIFLPSCLPPLSSSSSPLPSLSPVSIVHSICVTHSSSPPALSPSLFPSYTIACPSSSRSINFILSSSNPRSS